MKSEAYLFAGVAVFFLLTDVAYIWFAREPAGIAALTVSCFMASVIAFFCLVNHRRKGPRPEDRQDGEVHERSGRLDFFPPHSRNPVVTAAGVTLCAVGVVYGFWLFMIGIGVLAIGLLGMVLEFADRDDR
ncbi:MULTISPECIES: aa3-type cytochrome oxidase subunit IV [Streptomyces]|uniref:aa3-type cytochrome oxidase subunit IV n=1 Tax=Streptomyces TaxID=1883 RepID=UPI0001D06122|nr:MULTISPECIES: cytochrome c oxidase subunit 4 [Streptomyces]MYX45764.1 cytochrome C oxidase subunit IV [Streptomyces sp. SID89]NED73771.1 cytochrome C oxidase subunit IV [Streptomyces sp. SID9944]EFF88443.1 integral membrane protein [Streptomyces sp. e14]MBY8865771.1 cytochrome c oxidase subunit 4 [Streptomyces sennicomposti]NMO36837.1 cytochrome c oxidase subunit 4 [Streptomyces sp. GMY02]